MHRRVSCPRVEPSKCKIRPGKALAKAKAARKGFGPWWNVLRAGFETSSNCSISTWQGAGNGLLRGASRCAGWFRDRRGQEKGHEATDIIARKMALADAAHLR